MLSKGRKFLMEGEAAKASSSFHLPFPALTTGEVLSYHTGSKGRVCKVPPLSAAPIIVFDTVYHL